MINDKYIARNPLAVTYIQSAPSGARITIDDIVGDAWEGDNINRKTKIDIDRFDVFKQ